MAMYRITKFSAPNMDKAQEISESMRDILESVGADFIDIVSCGNGEGLVVAKYPSQTVMDAATETAKQAFGKMVESGAINGASIQATTGEVLMSF